ncbi:MAG: hypothetical protein AAGA92_07440 [Planctomycetota bacterium]
MNGAYYALLGQVTNWQRLGDGLHKPGGRAGLGEMLGVLAGVVALAGLVFAIEHLRRRFDFTLTCNDSTKLFRELCNAHELDYPSRRLLRRVSAAAGFDEPAAVFLSPEWFDPERLPKRLAAEERRLQELRERLF